MISSSNPFNIINFVFYTGQENDFSNAIRTGQYDNCNNHWINYGAILKRYNTGRCHSLYKSSTTDKC